jgi:transglutaminase superfamily protein
MEPLSVSVWSTWSRISPAERSLLVAACVRVFAVRVALWVLPSKWIIRYVKRLALPTNTAGGDTRVSPGEIVWAVDAASRRIPDASCLTQAVSALLLLRRHGYEAQFCVGVARGKSGSLDAHAWLERDGRVLIGRSKQPFVRLPDLAGT